jgi:ABC-type uncharacterized transport system substrate-binding protein
VSVLGKFTYGWLCGLFVSVPVFGGPILVLKGPNAAPYKEALSGFRQVYPGGLEIDFGKKDEFLTRVQTDPPPLIVAIGRASAEMAHQLRGAIPLVFLMVPNPAESGLTQSNIAGISMTIPGSVQLAHFKQLLPDQKKPVAIIYNPATGGPLVAEAQAAAAGLGLVLEQVPVESPEQVRLRIELVKPIIGAVWVVPDESFVTKERSNKWFTFLLTEAAALHLPLLVTMNPGSTFVREGALAALVSDFLGMGRQCGELVKQITAGKTKLEHVGLQPPEAITWEVNVGTAQKIGLTLPPTVLKSAKTYR